MKTIISLIFLISISINCQPSADAAKKFIKDSFTFGSTTINYRLLIPQDKSEPLPLILTLHGSGERGNDNEKHILLNHVASVWADSINQEKYPCYIFSPQCPENRRWVNVNWKESSYNADTVSISDELSTVIMILRKIMDEYPVDKNRIYITGISMGGFGTWDILVRYPDIFAAGIPLCGAGDPSKAGLIKHIPIWAFHGALDQAVPVEGSRIMVEALRNSGAKIIYTEYENLGHGIWTETYQNRILIDWLFAQKK